MQYQNTPLPDLSLSPSQILFCHNIRDYIPTHLSHYELHKEWVISTPQQEQFLSRRTIELVHATMQLVINFMNYEEETLLSSRTKVLDIYVNRTDLVELLRFSQIVNAV